jgi:hypothetical protein
MAAADGSDYGLDNAWRDARARLNSLEDWLDPGTTGHPDFSFMSQLTIAAWGQRLLS